jgi:hypothetical protein
MIQNQDITSFFILFVLLVFYFFQLFQRVKLVYLFRSVSYHFRNILLPYNSDDLGISGSGTSLINYFHYFYIFFFLLINGVIISYYGVWNSVGNIKLNSMNYDLSFDYLDLNVIILLTLLIRFLLIRFVLELFINYKLKFIFFKNFIINIIIGLLMFFSLIIYNLNSFYDINYLYYPCFILIVLHIFFQTKNYLSYFSTFNLKEVMYFILYLCTFKLAPWIWFYSFTF